MLKCKCPNGPLRLVVCGGESPYVNHLPAEEKAKYESTDQPPDKVPGNVYFYMGLDGKYERELYSDIPFVLDENDWIEMEAHADGGCCGEPQCEECKEVVMLPKGFLK